AVDSKAHERAGLEDLEVDVGSAFAHRLREERVDELDDRRVVLGLEEIGDFRKLLGQLREVYGLPEIFDDCLRRRRLARVRERQAMLEFLRREQHFPERSAR